MELSIKPIRFFRMGDTSIQTCPLKIFFNNVKNVFDILRAESKIRSTDFFFRVRVTGHFTSK